MNNIHVFIDGIGTSTAQNVVKDIAEFYHQSVTITGFDMTHEQPGKFLCDNFHILPSARSEDYTKKLAGYLEKYVKEDPDSYKVFIPIIDYGFLKNFSIDLSYKYGDKILLSNKPTFVKKNCEAEQHIFLASASYNTLQCYMNKLTMYEFFNFFSSTDVEVPFKLPKSSGEWFVSDYPLIVKPRNFGRASIGVKECNSKAETVSHCEVLKGDLYLPIVQEKIEGVEITVDCLCDLQGNYISSLSRERIDVKSGVSQKARIFKDDVLIECARFIAKTSDFKGPFNAQFILNSKGYHLIEINPRFSGGLNLSNSAGFHSPCALLDMISDYFKRDSSDLNLLKVKYLNYKEGKAYKTSTAVFDDGY